MQIKYLNLISYSEALNLMQQYHAEVVAHPEHKGFLLVLQHPPTVTMGKRELIEDMKIAPEGLKFKGVDYHKIDRGGSVTVHEPGQIVIYPIININYYKLSVMSFVEALEQAMIESCTYYNVHATRDEINPGVWVEKEKIGAVGIRISNRVTKHGIAFNVINNLDTFSYIIPCGLKGRGVTSLEIQLNKKKTIQNKDLFFQEVEIFLAEKVKYLLENTFKLSAN